MHNVLLYGNGILNNGDCNVCSYTITIRNIENYIQYKKAWSINKTYKLLVLLNTY